MIRLYVHKGVADEHEHLLRSFVSWAHKNLRIEHYICVSVPFAGALITDDSVYMMSGAFLWPHDPATRRLRIVIAGDRAPADVVKTLAHELAHYERWRDGGSDSEYGIGLRAKNLMNRWLWDYD